MPEQASESWLKKGYDLISPMLGLPGSSEKSDGGKSSGNFITDFLMQQLGFKEKAEKVTETAEKERKGLFGEVMQTGLNRYFPKIAKFIDIAKTGGQALGVDRGPESYPLEHEFESITAFSALVPDSWLSIVTDPLKNCDLVMKVVNAWPMMPSDVLEGLSKDDYDPDDMISALRVMHQDIVLGKTTLDKVIGSIPGLGEGGKLDMLKKLLS